MEEIIASGQADVVEIARGLIADPDLPLRLGQAENNQKVPALFGMFSTLINRGQFYCAINPESGRKGYEV